MRACDIDRSGDVWVYSPTCPVTGRPRHKTAYRGKLRPILIGPQLQAYLMPILAARYPDEYLFRPADAPFSRGKVGTRYINTSYGRAIARAIERENDRRRQLAVDLQKRGVQVEAVLVPHWSPLQLRHLVLTRFKEAAGWRAAQELAGHSLEATTRGYVEERMPLALEAARRLG